jgi:hypothetical protein
MSASPQSNGTTARCFRPYMRNPKPIDPNNNPQKSDAVFNGAKTPPYRSSSCDLSTGCQYYPW